MSHQRDSFFDGAMYLVDVRGWPPEKVRTAQAIETPIEAPDGARLGVWAIHPHHRHPLPQAAPDAGQFLTAERFSLKHSGNRTLQAPKRSWAVDFAHHAELAGMARLNLKSMYNDPSQMREALAWQLFG